MELSEKTNVIISGGSIAGLTTAYWLTKYGFNVTIVERSSFIREGGQALDIRGSALEVVRRMGILEEIKQNSTKLKGMSMIDAVSGEEIYHNTEHTFTRGNMDSPDIEILRDDLCKVLFEKVNGPVKFIFNDTITSLYQDETGVDVTFANSTPKRFDLVIGADGLRSNVRRLVFGADENFTRYLGYYIAIFTMHNFLDLEYWEVFFQHENAPLAVMIAKNKSSEARTYLGFGSEKPIQYDYHDIEAQKKLVSERVPNVGKYIPEIIKYMQQSTNFYFDSLNQVIMDSWSKNRVVLVGDAGYSPSISLGQSTTVAMVGAYVLSGELATNKNNLQRAFSNYDDELREYVETNQQQAFNTANDADNTISEDNVPDLSQSVVSFNLKDYTI